MDGHLQAFARTSEIERRAQCLSDPIARLRYLRRATANPPKRPQRKSWIAWCALAVIILTWRSDALVRHSAVPARYAVSAVGARLFSRLDSRVFRPAMAMFTANDAVLPFPLRQSLDRVDSQLDVLIYEAFPLPKSG
jgi:hypothetical protein